MRVLLIDNYDSFTWNLVHLIGGLGAQVDVWRNDALSVEDALGGEHDAIVLSPGPCTPNEAGICLDLVREGAGVKPIFGVCLGLQALAEAYGGELRQLHIPMHGKPSRIRVSKPGVIFSGLPKEITVGRYHSIFADPVRLPDDFVVTAETEDGVIMAFEHRKEPIAAVQFHPESIMTLGQNAGMRMIENVVAHLPRKAKEKAA